MAPRTTMSDEQRRLLRIAGLMPSGQRFKPGARPGDVGAEHTSDAEPAAPGRLGVVGAEGNDGAQAGAVVSDPRAVDLLYSSDHEHPAPREAARAALPEGYSSPPPADYAARFTQDHEHRPHLEHLTNPPFLAGLHGGEPPDGAWHEHPP